MNFAYETESKAWATKFLTSHSDLLTLATIPSQSRGSHFVIGEYSIHNRAGETVVAGIGGRIRASCWKFYVWDDSEYAAASALVDDTTDAQDSGTGDVNLDTVGTNNDGFVIASDVPFNIASLVISQASTAGTVWQAYYSTESAGTGFSSNFTELTNFYVSPNFSATGEQLIWFDAPADWHRVLPATALVNRHGRSDQQVLGYTPSPQYLLVVKSTTAPNSARGQMSIATIGRMFHSTENVQDNDILHNIGGIDIHLPPACDAIAAAITTANPQNRVDCKWRYAG